MFNIEGKHILVTGASSGIGRVVAKQIANSGAVVGLSGRNIEELERTRGMLDGGGHYIVPSDLLAIDDTSSIFDEAVTNNGKLDGLIYSAGIIDTVPLQAIKVSKFETLMKVNLFMFVDMVKNFAKKKYSNGGSIIGISSIASVSPDKGQTMYSASKAAMDAATQTMSQELYKKNIRINTILPGVVKPDKINYEVINDSILEKQLLGLVDPEDIGKMCVYLSSEASKSISGRKFYIDGMRY